MAAFLNGDTPVATFDYVLPVEPDGADAASLTVGNDTIPATIDGDAVVGNWTALTLPAVGAHPVYAVLTAGERTQRFLVDTLVVVDPDDEWFNVITARIDWDGAPVQDGTLHRLLNLAREQVEAYAPALPFGQPVPERYRSAQLVQARNTFNASITNGDNSMDVGSGIIINIRPLDWAVKQMIRPPRGLKAVG